MAMGTREPLIGGDEYDYLTPARRHYRKRARKFTPVKAKFWRRIRKLHRLSLLREMVG